MTLLVEPKSVQGGARAGLRNGKIRFYNDSAKKAYQTQIILESKHHAPKTPLTGAISVNYIFWLARAASNSDTLPARVKPDVINLAKHTEDALTQAGFWKDDKQIITTTIHKRFTEGGLPPRIEVCITPLEQP